MRCRKREPEVYLVQKLVTASSIAEAIATEAQGKIVEVTLTTSEVKKLEPAVGFMYKENINIDE